MQKENFGKGVTIGQRIGLSFCDELKLRRFYAEPGIRGRKQCEVWSPRFRALTCKGIVLCLKIGLQDVQVPGLQWCTTRGIQRNTLHEPD